MRSEGENQQSQPTYDAGSGNRTLTTLPTKTKWFYSGLCALYASFLLMKAEHQVFNQSTMYLLKSFPFQINIQFHWTRELAPSTAVVFLVSCQPRFHSALFKDMYLYLPQ